MERSDGCPSGYRTLRVTLHQFDCVFRPSNEDLNLELVFKIRFALSTTWRHIRLGPTDQNQDAENGVSNQTQELALNFE